MAEEHGEVVDHEELDGEREARRLVALAQIRQFPDPVLRLRAREVEAFDDDLQGLVRRMKSLMVDARGVGLAANQVGVLRRVFVFQDVRGEDAPVQAVVNPRIVDASDERAPDSEGCLSLQGVLVPVERHVALVLEGHDEEGREVRLELTDLGARVVQHELDHLDGVLIVDRTTPEARRGAMAVLRAQPSID